MGRCAQNAVQRGKLIRNERGNFFQGFALQCYEQIEAAGTQAELLENCPLYKTMWEAHISVKDDGEVA